MNEIDKVCEAAIVESQILKMNKRKAKALKKDPHQKLIFTRQIVSMEDEPVSLDNFKNGDQNIKATMGNYALCYLGTMNFQNRANTPYVIRQDLINMNIYVSGPKHWHCVCERIPECGWLERNTTLTDELFSVAKMHPGMNFLFTVKWTEYSNKIAKKAQEKNIDIDHKTFMTYKMSKKRYEDDFKKLEFAELKTQADYLSELNEAEKESSLKGE